MSNLHMAPDTGPINFNSTENINIGAYSNIDNNSGGGFDQLRSQTAVSWRNTLSLRVTRNLSFNYFVEVDLEPQVTDQTQIQQSLYLRASWMVL